MCGTCGCGVVGEVGIHSHTQDSDRLRGFNKKRTFQYSKSMECPKLAEIRTISRLNYGVI